jgi:cellulose synthase/poly-beta-1,6-N-acetylglucosamine synthase-like glycosyltransferase
MLFGEIVFWVSAALVAYAYVGYPLLLWLLAFLNPHEVDRGDISPSVSLVITAYNEEKRITEKLENTLALSYPMGRLEIIVASDCSTDKTDEIVKSYAPRGVKLIRAPERRGKEAAQNLAVQAANGEFLLFSDVATVLPKDAVSNIVKNFHDPTVGCVSSEDRHIDADGKISGEGAYVKYEMFLRSLETRANSLVGLSGSFFAARKSVCQNWAKDLQSDFNTLLNAVRQGMRGVSDPSAIGYYRNISDEKKEYDRKVRTVLRGIAVFMRSLHLLNPFRYGLFSWQLFSHKLCRWLVPFTLVTMLTGNFLLAGSNSFYQATLCLQVLFYGAGVIGWVFPNLIRAGIGKIPTFFLVVNASIVHAWYRYVRGDRIVGWQPSERSSLDVPDR